MTAKMMLMSDNDDDHHHYHHRHHHCHQYALISSVGKQDQVVPCILQLMQKWNKTQCSEQDRLIMTARGGQLLALMEGFCGDRRLMKDYVC